MKHASLNAHDRCPLHTYLSGNSGALPQDPTFCPDCTGPDDETMCCALTLILYLSTRCKDPMAFLSDCRAILNDFSAPDAK